MINEIMFFFYFVEILEIWQNVFCAWPRWKVNKVQQEQNAQRISYEAHKAFDSNEMSNFNHSFYIFSPICFRFEQHAALLQYRYFNASS